MESAALYIIPPGHQISLQSSNKIQSSRKIELDLLCNKGKVQKCVCVQYLSPLFMLHFQASYNSLRLSKSLYLTSTSTVHKERWKLRKFDRYFKEELLKRCKKICLLLKRCSFSLTYLKKRYPKAKPLLGDFPQRTLDWHYFQTILGRIMVYWLRRTTEIPKLPGFLLEFVLPRSISQYIFRKKLMKLTRTSQIQLACYIAQPQNLIQIVI